MEKKGSFFIFLFIIAAQTLVVAALAVLLFVVRPTATTAEADEGDAYSVFDDKTAPGADNVTLTLPPPDEADLTSLTLFDATKAFNLKSVDPSAKPNVIILGVDVKYFNTIEGIEDVAAKLDLNTPNLKEIVTMYFQDKTLDEVRLNETVRLAKEELKSQMNEYLLGTISDERVRRGVTAIIYEVAFSGWSYQ